jgi:hypothetical protein
MFGCPPGYPSLKQPLAEPSGCSVTLRRSLSGFLLQIIELKEFSFLLSAHLLNALLAEYLLPELSTVLSPSMHPMRLLNAHLAELSESSMILVSLNSQQSSSKCTTVHMLNAHLAELYRTPQSFFLQLCLFPHSLASKVSSNLEAFIKLLIPVLVSQHIFV